MEKQISELIGNEGKSPAELRKARARATVQALDEWLADDSGYDERVWPLLKPELENSPLSFRSRSRG